MSSVRAITLLGLLAAADLAAGHGAITSATGDAGGSGMALGVDNSTPRDGTRRRPFQQDSTRFRGKSADTFGETLAGGANELETGMQNMMAQSGGQMPQITPGGQVSMTLHQVNADGGGPYKCMMSADASGQDWQDIDVTQNVPGRGSINLGGGATDFDLNAAVPNNMNCTGSVGGQNNVCLVRCQNKAIAGPFGGVVPVQMATANTNNANTNNADTANANTGNANTNNTGNANAAGDAGTANTNSGTSNTGSNTNTGNTGSNTGNTGSNTGANGNTDSGTSSNTGNNANSGNAGSSNTGNTGSNTNSGSSTGSNAGSTSNSNTNSGTGNTGSSSTSSGTGNTGSSSNTGGNAGSGNSGSSSSSGNGNGNGSKNGNNNNSQDEDDEETGDARRSLADRKRSGGAVLPVITKRQDNITDVPPEVLQELIDDWQKKH